MRRNDVVGLKADSYIMYGRIVRFIGKQHVEVVDCGRFRSIYHVDDVEPFPDYTGYVETRRVNDQEFQIYHRMPGLRKLKQMSRQYDEFVWKRNRPKNLEEETWPNSDRHHAGDAGAILLLYGPG